MIGGCNRVFVCLGDLRWNVSVPGKDGTAGCCIILRRHFLGLACYLNLAFWAALDRISTSSGQSETCQACSQLVSSGGVEGQLEERKEGFELGSFARVVQSSTDAPSMVSCWMPHARSPNLVWTAHGRADCRLSCCPNVISIILDATYLGFLSQYSRRCIDGGQSCYLP